jgi:hypothetical protein
MMKVLALSIIAAGVMMLTALAFIVIGIFTDPRLTLAGLAVGLPSFVVFMLASLVYTIFRDPATRDD